MTDRATWIGMPDGTYFLGRRASTSVTGRTTSSYLFECWEEDYAAIEAFLLYATDNSDLNLMCESISHNHKHMQQNPNDGNEYQSRLACEARFVPYWQVLAQMPDQPFVWRSQSSQTGITLNSVVWTWQSTPAITLPASQTASKPFLPIPVIQFGLSGVRSVCNLAGPEGYSSIQGCVNDSAWEGAAAGCVLMTGGAYEQFMQPDGTIAWRVELRGEYRPIPWNYDFRDDLGIWDVPLGPTGEPKLVSVDYSGLLSLGIA